MHAFVEQYDLDDRNDQTELIIAESSSGLELSWSSQASTKRLKYCIDVEQFAAQQKTFPAPKQGAFNQALGKKTKQIIDATGGWGGDTLLMCAQGYQVTIIERHPVMALLLKDAMNRLALTQWAHCHDVKIPHVIEVNAIELLAQKKIIADCVYLDPMFPTKRKKSAAVNKNMQLLQWLVGADLDADNLLQAALDSNYTRIAVKRPDYAQPLLINNQKPNEQFSSKLVHYDVYLNWSTD